MDAIVNMIPAAVDQKLKSFVALKAGWHFGEGVQINLGSITAARRLLVAAHSKNPGVESDVFPGINGEVRVCIYNGQEVLEFTSEPDFKITYRREQNDVEVEAETSLTLNDAYKKVMSTIPSQCPSSASFPYSTTTSAENGGSPVSLSGPGGTAQFQSSTKIVSLNGQLRLVATFGNAILASNLYFYGSKPMDYQLATGS